MKQQTWEERFEEEFTVMDEDSGGNLQRVLFLDTGTFMESIDSEIKLKKFIQSELQRQREEIEKKFITTWVDIDGGRYHFCYRFENNEWCPTFQKGMVHLDCEYCKQRDDIIKKVKEI